MGTSETISMEMVIFAPMPKFAILSFIVEACLSVIASGLAAA
jgi:hypothetical protein